MGFYLNGCSCGEKQEHRINYEGDVNLTVALGFDGPFKSSDASQFAGACSSVAPASQCPWQCPSAPVPQYPCWALNHATVRMGVGFALRARRSARACAITFGFKRLRWSSRRQDRLLRLAEEHDTLRGALQRERPVQPKTLSRLALRGAHS